MRPADLRLMYEYGHDRNMKLLDKAEELTEEQVSGEPPFGHDSVREIFFHVANWERIWRSLWQTGEWPVSLNPEDYPNTDSLRVLMTENNEQTLAYIDRLTEEDLDGEFSPRPGLPAVPLWQQTTHVFNHGTQHRGEIAMLLTHFGHSPGDLDLALFVFERAGD